MTEQFNKMTARRKELEEQAEREWRKDQNREPEGVSFLGFRYGFVTMNQILDRCKDQKQIAELEEEVNRLRAEIIATL